MQSTILLHCFLKLGISCGSVHYVVQDGFIFKSVDETLVCDHSNKNNRAVLSYGTVYYVEQGSKFVDETLVQGSK